MLEEVIKQYPELSEFHLESVNTVRILTVLLQSGEAVAVAAAFRCGQGGAITDNAGVIYAGIDMESSRIITDTVSDLHLFKPLHLLL